MKKPIAIWVNNKNSHNPTRISKLLFKIKTIMKYYFTIYDMIIMLFSKLLK